MGTDKRTMAHKLTVADNVAAAVLRDLEQCWPFGIVLQVEGQLVRLCVAVKIALGQLVEVARLKAAEVGHGAGVCCATSVAVVVRLGLGLTLFPSKPVAQVTNQAAKPSAALSRARGRLDLIRGPSMPPLAGCSCCRVFWRCRAQPRIWDVIVWFFAFFWSHSLIP